MNHPDTQLLFLHFRAAPVCILIISHSHCHHPFPVCSTIFAVLEWVLAGDPLFLKVLYLPFPLASCTPLFSSFLPPLFPFGWWKADFSLAEASKLPEFEEIFFPILCKKNILNAAVVREKMSDVTDTQSLKDPKSLERQELVVSAFQSAGTKKSKLGNSRMKELKK